MSWENETLNQKLGKAYVSLSNEFDENPIENVEERIKDLEDVNYGSQNISKLVYTGTQTLASGVASYQPSKSSLDVYTLTYEDYEE